MKVSDGYRRSRADLLVLHPTEVYEVRSDANSVTVLAPTRAIERRGDALNRPTATVTLSSPAEGVIRVRVTTLAGSIAGRRSDFPAPRDTEPEIEIGDEAVTLTAGTLAARIDRHRYQIDFIGDGRVLTSALPRGTGIVRNTRPGEQFAYEQR